MMKTKLTCALIALTALASCGRDQGAAGGERLLTLAEQNALVGEYCIRCHNYDDYKGGMELELFEAARAHEDIELAEKMIRKLRAGQMPPQGEPRPDFETAQAMAASLEATVDSHSDYSPGWRGLHRLNRAEYQNVVRDLVGVELDASEFLPTDDSSNGFDNQAGALGLSPALLQAYLSAAGEISRLALGEATAPTQATYRVAADATQNYQVEGLPFGTRGGILIDHVFPADGNYDVKIFSVNVGNMGNFRPFGEVRGEQLVVLLDGAVIQQFDWDAELGGGRDDDDDDDPERGQLRTIDLRIPVTAGSHKLGVTFLATNYAPGLDLNDAFARSTIETGGLPGFTFYPHVGAVRIDGPFDAKRAEDSESRRMILTCAPKSVEQERPCAEEIITRLARRAYRGTGTQKDIDELLAFYDQGREAGDFEKGIQAALERMLMDPKLIYRVETPPEGVAPGEDYELNDIELASRLSFFLWSTMPDEELLSLAEAGRLGEPRVLEAQVRRMLADPRSMALTENFAGQWLAIRNLEGHAPVVDEFPDFDDNLRQSFRREMELFFDSLIREDRSALELLTADYTFLDERLAVHYGIPGVKGSRFRRVELGPELDARRGLLGKGGLLTISSQPGRTSPVIRGNWVLGNVLGAPAPDPPPSVAAKVAAFQPTSGDAAGNVRPQTLREQFEQHRNDPACLGCHTMMDPIGFALEPFDATGRYRTVDAAGNPINSADVMYDGTPINGPTDLREVLLKYRMRFLHNVADKLLTYAVGRGMEPADMPVVRSVVRQAAEDDYRFQSLILAVVQSEAFRMSTKPPGEELVGNTEGAAAGETRLASTGERAR
jgi:hypothetical protein